MAKFFGLVLFFLLIIGVMIAGYYVGKLFVFGVKYLLSRFRKKGKVYDNIVRSSSGSSRNS